MSERKKKAFAWHPFLFGLFPILFLYAQNAREMVLGDIFLPIGITLAATLVLLVVLRVIFKSLEKSALLTTIILLLFFTYGHLVTALKDFRIVLQETVIGPNGVVLVVWLVLLYYAVKIVRRTRRDLKGATRVLNRLAALLVVIQIAQGGYVLLTREEVTKTAQESEIAPGETPELKPDVYFICVDGYGRHDILKEIYGYDNSGFIDFLKDRGFKVADESHSNYCQTLLSLGATFDLNYIDQLGEFDAGSYDRMPLAEMFWDNEVFRQFKSRGYTNVVFSSGYTFTEFETADKYFASAWSVSEFDNILMATTPLPLILYNEKSLFDGHRKRINFILNKLPEIYEVGSPKFVFAHILSPHPPFVFDKQGRAVPQDRTFSYEDGSHYMNNGGTVKEYLKSYKAQITYLTARLQETIEKLLEQNRENPPVIIIEADHGPGSGLSWVGMDKTNLKERFSILNAVYLPGIDTVIDYRHFSPVNTFRMLFNLYFKTDYKILPNRYYYATWAHPFNFREVTRILDPSAYDARNFLKTPKIDYDKYRRPKKQGTRFNAEGCCLIGNEGVTVTSLPNSRTRRLEISVDHNDGYALYFRKDTTMVALVNVGIKLLENGGLRVDTLTVPEKARREGYDNILVAPYGGDGRYSLGHLRYLK